MVLSLSPELDLYVRHQVKVGAYTSENEVVNESLRLLKSLSDDKAARLEEIREKLREGRAQIERGECVVFSSPEEIYSHFTQKARELNAQRHNSTK